MQKLKFSKDRVAEAMDLRDRWYGGEDTERTPFVFGVGAPKNNTWMAGNPHNFKEMLSGSDVALEGHLAALQHAFDSFPDCDFLPVMHLYYFGQGILASIYGAEQLVVELDPPYTKGRIYKDIYEAGRLTNEFDFERTEWGAMLKEHVERFVDATDGQVPVGPPDYQSPLGTAIKLMPNEELMMAMIDEPELTAAFLDKVADGIIKLSGLMEKWAGPGNYAHNHSNPIPGRCGGMLWDDYISVITPELHMRVCGPSNKKVFSAFGNGHLHTCGPYFPGYMDACLACGPRSMDVTIMRGMGKTREDMLGFLAMTEERGIRLFGGLSMSAKSIFDPGAEQPDEALYETFMRGGFMPTGYGTHEEGLRFKGMVGRIDERIRG